jgi:hypothetical protein
MQNLRVYKKMKHDMQSKKERSTNQVSKRLENLTMHDSLTILEAFLLLVIGKLVGLHEAFDINPLLQSV